MKNISDEIDAIGRALYGTNGTMYNTLSEFMSWLVPVGGFSSSGSLTGYTLYEMVDFICYLLGYAGQSVSTIYDFMGEIASNSYNIYTQEASTTNSILNLQSYLNKAIGNWKNGDNWSDVTASSVREFAHRQLISNLATGEYSWRNVLSSGNVNDSTRKWGLGTPLGTI